VQSFRESSFEKNPATGLLGKMRLAIIIAVLAIVCAHIARLTNWENPSVPTCEGSKCVVLVTGASRGIGRATSHELAKAGYTVFACVRKEGDLAQYDNVEGITGVLLDVRNTTQMEALMQTLPPLWALVNNAGRGGDNSFELSNSWEDALDTNLLAPMRLAKLALPEMRRNRGGRIVNIGSLQSELSLAGAVPYGVSKAGLRSFSDGLRRETLAFGVHVSTIQPGFTSGTDMPREVLPRMKRLQQELKVSPDGKDYLHMYTQEQMESFGNLFDATVGPIEEVTKDILHAIQSPRPFPVYTQSILKWLFFFLNKFIPTVAVDAVLSPKK